MPPPHVVASSLRRHGLLRPARREQGLQALCWFAANEATMTQDLILRCEGIEAGLRPGVGGAFTHLTDLTGEGPVDLLRRARPDFTDVLDSAGFPLVPFCNRVRDGRFAFG